jgi:hypothetical protein
VRRSTCILIDFVQDLRMIGQQNLEEDTIAKRQISEHCAWLEEVGKSFRGIACEEIGGSVRLDTTTSERFPSTTGTAREGEEGLSHQLSSEFLQQSQAALSVEIRRTAQHILDLEESLVSRVDLCQPREDDVSGD